MWPFPPSPTSFTKPKQTKMAADCTPSYSLNEQDKLPERVVLWNEIEAAEKQVKQVGASACGATAVLNVLKLLGKTAEVDAAIKAVNTKLRDLDAPLPQYLLSRSVAGTTHTDLIKGLDKISQGKVIGRFFHMFPERKFDLSNWLKYWLVNGAIPLATLNCQKVTLADGTIPDAWHHQVICGVSRNGIHLINPNEVSPFNVVSLQLCSESVLLIRRHDVLQRWSNALDYSCWSSEEKRWGDLNVQDQIDQMVKEETLLVLHGKELKHRELLMTHIAIPAAYQSGITLFVLKDSKAHKLLENANELPLSKSACQSTSDDEEQASWNEKTLSIDV